jgi:hypothetical protein
VHSLFALIFLDGHVAFILCWKIIVASQTLQSSSNDKGIIVTVLMCGMWQESNYGQKETRLHCFVIHLAWICKMTSECNKYAFSTLSKIVIQPTFKL